MSDIEKALKLVSKGFKKKEKELKLTPEQLEQLLKVFLQVQSVLQGTGTIKDLEKENNKMLVKMAKTFIEEAAEKANDGGSPKESD
ncbi:hypothetical protein [Marinomonas mediterranea]|uniref:Uncharacterized protein n=1 Tax=Marinomonas mediterranea (strain ATCC 700492 / JCM 21426 / NBRC 103028 / MMB-1) TaxID=717774 RepID=F2JXH7_MARM1|nr:hypothetical protein [Marinomonas mediterranea]ADZ91877.1 hypothetical protein Marme_2646 [Marinomonas mediterranea MMB-1]WCN09832.1 hypothetical protein GV055_13355 [Marinomonas mediterranea]WCN13916.1 hypothetical protein GV054_13370 [Marinomonas mediterranea]WCN17969.1 hypothetical protein GV053_13395 [Marinomonas mediterranea MMB-1]